MKIILSSNPYRDRGLKAAQEAKRILERENIEAVLCLPFTPRKGERVEIPAGVEATFAYGGKVFPAESGVNRYECDLS